MRKILLCWRCKNTGSLNGYLFVCLFFFLRHYTTSPTPSEKDFGDSESSWWNSVLAGSDITTRRSSAWLHVQLPVLLVEPGPGLHDVLSKTLVEPRMCVCAAHLNGDVKHPHTYTAEEELKKGLSWRTELKKGYWPFILGIELRLLLCAIGHVLCAGAPEKHDGDSWHHPLEGREARAHMWWLPFHTGWEFTPGMLIPSVSGFLQHQEWPFKAQTCTEVGMLTLWGSLRSCGTVPCGEGWKQKWAEVERGLRQAPTSSFQSVLKAIPRRRTSLELLTHYPLKIMKACHQAWSCCHS